MVKGRGWEDWVGVAAGAWLVASPWAAGFVHNSNSATANACTMGTLLVLLELGEMEGHENATDWIDLVVGLWLIVSPTVLEFASVTAASVHTLTIGLLTPLVA